MAMSCLQPQNMTRKDIESAARDQLVVYKLCAAQMDGSAGGQPGAGAANGTASAGVSSLGSFPKWKCIGNESW